jgi:hypothetical protein
MSEQFINLVDVMRDSRVKGHIEEMRDIGTVLLQESGFAVYDASGGYDVSDLVIPEVRNDEGFEQAFADSNSFDAAPIVRKDMTLDCLTKEEKESILVNGSAADRQKLEKTSLSHVLSAKAARKIEAIKNSVEIDESEKQDLIETILYRDRGVDGNVRTDIVLLAHNHPLSPLLINKGQTAENLSDVILPSEADLRSHEHCKIHNSMIVDLIVAADFQQIKGLFFKRPLHRPAQVDIYASRYSPEISAARNLANLAMAGYDVVVVDFTKKGGLTPSGGKKLREFITKD